MNFQEANQAIQDAKNTLDKADKIVNDIGYLMIGRLKQMSPYTLEKIKKELQDFNAVTKEWK